MSKVQDMFVILRLELSVDVVHFPNGPAEMLSGSAKTTHALQQLRIIAHVPLPPQGQGFFVLWHCGQGRKFTFLGHCVRCFASVVKFRAHVPPVQESLWLQFHGRKP